MFSQKNLVVLLVVAIVALGIETAALVDLNLKLKNAEINLGGSSAVNLTNDGGGAPSMVGGC